MFVSYKMKNSQRSDASLSTKRKTMQVPRRFGHKTKNCGRFDVELLSVEGKKTECMIFSLNVSIKINDKEETIDYRRNARSWLRKKHSESIASTSLMKVRLGNGKP